MVTATQLLRRGRGPFQKRRESEVASSAAIWNLLERQHCFGMLSSRLVCIRQKAMARPLLIRKAWSINHRRGDLRTIFCPSPRGLLPPPPRLPLFPSALDGGFLIGPSIPQFLEDAIFHHLTLQRFDGIFDAIILNFDFQGFLPLLPEQVYTSICFCLFSLRTCHPSLPGVWLRSQSNCVP